MTTAILITPGTVIFFAALFLAALATYLGWRYDTICREDARRRQRSQRDEEWEWPVKLAGPENRTRLPL